MGTKYTLPELKSEKSPAVEVDVAYDSLEHDPWLRQVRILASKEQVDALTVGDNIEVKLVGKVSRLESSQTEKGSARNEFELELISVETPETNEFAALVEDDD